MGNVFIRRLAENDVDNLFSYLNALSDASKKRFGPHPFDREAICKILGGASDVIAYGAFEAETNLLIAYSLIKRGYLLWDKERLEAYGLMLNEQSDCTFAPSVADAWQNQGIGSRVFDFILSDLPPQIRRIILWGGVQADNALAVQFYQRKNFRILGSFEHNGCNWDMVAEREGEAY